MLRKPFHGRRINQEIQKLTAIRTPSPYLNPVREPPGSATRPTPLTSLSPLPPKSRFRFTRQSLSTSTSSLATGPSAAAYYSRAPDTGPNTHLEDPNLNVECLRESSDDRRETGGDGEGFCRRRTLPEERVLMFTCVSEDGECRVYVVRTKHNSRELRREEESTECLTLMERNTKAWHYCPLGTLESLERNPEVVNKLEVHPGDMDDVAEEEMKKYGGKVMPLSEQVANKLEVYLGRGFRVAYEEAMKYGVGFMMHHFTLQVALCSEKRLSTEISLIQGSLMFDKRDVLDGPWKKRVGLAGCSRLWRLCMLRLLGWIQSGIYFLRKE